MGDLIGDAGGTAATLVPPDEITRLRAAGGDRYDVVRAFATACRLNTLGMIHLAGSGHIGSSFSSLDVVAWLHLDHLGDDDVYFSSKGHDVPGLYSVLLGLGRLDWALATRLRRLGGLPGHPDVATPGIPFNTGSLGMGISKAKGLIRADRLHGRRRRVVVMTGDGELQEGQIWESLATAARDAMDELTVVVDHNRLQSDLPVAQVSDLGDLEAKFTAFGWDVSRIDGHDLDQIAAAFTAPAHGPRAIVAETLKGAGVGQIEHTSRPPDERFYPFHSGALPDEVYQQARQELLDRLTTQFDALGLGTVNTEMVARDAGIGAPALEAPDADAAGPQALLAAYGRALVAAGREHANVVVLDADLMVDLALVGFRDTYPDRFVECGIAEQDMVSQAGGLAAGGALPVVNSFGTFLSGRPREQILNNASEHRTIVYMGALAGLVPAGPGHSHQAMQDVASFGSIPGMSVIAPSTERQVADAVALATSGTLGATYLRLCSFPVPVPYPDVALPPRGEGLVRLTGDGPVTVVGYGPTLLTEAFHAIAADDTLRGRVTLVELPWLTDLDDDWLQRTLAHAHDLVVLDDHHVAGGLGERLGGRLAARGMRARCHILGIEGFPECGTPDEVLRAHGLDRTSLRDRLLAMSADRILGARA
jgi:transketolase